MKPLLNISFRYVYPRSGPRFMRIYLGQQPIGTISRSLELDGFIGSFCFNNDIVSGRDEEGCLEKLDEKTLIWLKGAGLQLPNTAISGLPLEQAIDGKPPQQTEGA